MPDVGLVGRPTVALLDMPRAASAARRRTLFLAFVAVAALAGLLATGSGAASQAVAQSGPDLTRLLRAMAGIKAMAALLLVALTWWRLAAPISHARLAVYTLACGAMAVGPGLIWDMAHVEAGALLLHGGLLIVAVVLWRDPGMAARLAFEIARRRTRLRRAV